MSDLTYYVVADDEPSVPQLDIQIEKLFQKPSTKTRNLLLTVVPELKKLVDLYIKFMDEKKKMDARLKQLSSTAIINHLDLMEDLIDQLAKAYKSPEYRCAESVMINHLRREKYDSYDDWIDGRNVKSCEIAHTISNPIYYLPRTFKKFKREARKALTRSTNKHGITDWLILEASTKIKLAGIDVSCAERSVFVKLIKATLRAAGIKQYADVKALIEKLKRIGAI